jgi:hypothetical protein
MKNSKGEIKNKSKTNGWDFLTSLFNNLFNLKLSKVGALFLLWFLIRDVIFVVRLPKTYNFGDALLKETQIFKYIFQSDSLAIVILAAIIILLVVVIVMLIIYITIIRKEIQDMAKIRSDLMHGREKSTISPIKEHVSTAC